MKSEKALYGTLGGSSMTSPKLYRFVTPSQFDDRFIPNKSIGGATIWAGFKDRTTAHGIPHVNKAKGRIKTGFWAVISLFCLGFLIYHTAQVTMYYLQYKYNVAVALVNERQLIFPAVTVCNLNPIKASALTSSPQLEALLGDGSDVTVATTASSSPSVATSGASSGEALSQKFLVEEEVIELMSDMSEADQRALGYTAEELILSCQYSGYVCYPWQFSYTHDAVHGNCYTFNWNETDGFWTSFRTGRRYGLKMILNIQQDEYVGEINEAAGARVVIHSQDRMPLPQDEGLLLSPGEVTSVGTRQLDIERLPAPYGVCTDPDKRDIVRNVFEEHYPVKYSTNTCLKTCYQRELITRCGCADASYPRYGAAFDYVVVQACKRGNSAQEACRQDVLSLYNEDEIGCDCPNPCSETSFGTSTSSADWPSHVHETTLLDKYETQLLNTLSTTAADEDDEFRRNLLKVEVYFEDLNYQQVEEKPAYRIGNYFSDFGGILGLWVGCSVLSLFELLELGMDFLVLAYYRVSRRRPKLHAQSQAHSKSRLDPIAEEKSGDSLRKISPSPPPAYSVLDQLPPKPRETEPKKPKKKPKIGRTA